MVLLEENRCKVMRKQIMAMQKALVAAFSGNAQSVEQTMNELAKMETAQQDSKQNSHHPNSGGFHSFLEK
jgi:hypothetical protein